MKRKTLPAQTPPIPTRPLIEVEDINPKVKPSLVLISERQHDSYPSTVSGNRRGEVRLYEDRALRVHDREATSANKAGAMRLLLWK